MDNEWYILKPSLKQMTLMKIMIELWNLEDIRLLIRSFAFPSDEKRDFDQWKSIVRKVEAKLWQLPLPKNLIQAHIKYKYAIGQQIKSWWHYHHVTNRFLEDLPKEFRWTAIGTINLKETAETVVADESIDVIFRYKISCIYCLRDRVRELRRRTDFYDTAEEEGPNKTLVGFWLISEKGEPGFIYYFQNAVREGNLEAARFFLEKLGEKERAEALSKCPSAWPKMRNFPPAFHADLIFYLLARMSPAQRAAALKKSAHTVLLYCLKWPRQGLFEKILSASGKFRMSRAEYLFLVREIFALFQSSAKEYDYQTLFVDFWPRIPSTVRGFVLREKFPYLAYVAFTFFQGKVIPVLMREAGADLKCGLMFDRVGKGICAHLVVKEQWGWAKFLLNSCLPTKQLTIAFRTSLIGADETLIYKKKIFSRNRDKWGTFFRLLDDWILEKD